MLQFVIRDQEGNMSPVRSISQLDIGSVVCHTNTHGQGTVLEFKPKLGMRKGSSLDQFARKVRKSPSPTTDTTDGKDLLRLVRTLTC